MSDMRELLNETVERVARFLASLPERRVAAARDAEELVAALGGGLPQKGLPASDILAQLDEIGGQGVVASAGPRYFGFVTGGALPASLAASWLSAAWDQNAFSEVSSPVGAAVEQVAMRWVLEALDLPADAGAAFVTGATMANFAALAAARRAVCAGGLRRLAAAGSASGLKDASGSAARSAGAVAGPLGASGAGVPVGRVRRTRKGAVRLPVAGRRRRWPRFDAKIPAQPFFGRFGGGCEFVPKPFGRKIDVAPEFDAKIGFGARKYSQNYELSFRNSTRKSVRGAVWGVGGTRRESVRKCVSRPGGGPRAAPVPLDARTDFRVDLNRSENALSRPRYGSRHGPPRGSPKPSAELRREHRSSAPTQQAPKRSTPPRCRSTDIARRR